MDSSDVYKSYIVGFNNGKRSDDTELRPIYCLVPSNMVLAGVEWVRDVLNQQLANTKALVSSTRMYQENK